MLFNEKGQVFEPFKMLIGAVFALLVLVIIMSAVGYFQELRVDVSRQRFYSGFDAAVEQPNEMILVVQDLQFEEGTTFSSGGLAKRANMDSDCISFYGEDNGPFDIEDSLIKITQTSLMNVYFRCETGEVGCEVYCELSFGEEFD